MKQSSKTLLKFGISTLWGAVLATAFATTTPKPWLLTIIGVVLGCLSGYLRSRAVAADAPAKAANVLGWLCSIGLLLLAMAFAEDMFVGAWAASFAGYLFADSAYSLLAAYRKMQAAGGRVADGT